MTGGSSGIGLELAKQFAQNGFDVLIAADSDKVNTAAREIEALGAKVETAQVDLAKYEGVEQLYEKMRSSGRAVDALAVNAGVGVSGDFARDTDLRDELNLIDLNVRSSVHLTKRVLKDMVARGQGRVLITSSIAAFSPGPFEATYAASKAFLHSFAEAIRNELKDTGVTVTSLMPGATETSFFERANLTDTKLGASDKKDDAAEVARDGFEALMSSKDHVIAGSFKNKLQAAAAHLPETVKAEMHRSMSEPGSAKK